MEYLKIKLTILPSVTIGGKERTILQIPFTATASGNYFLGETSGICVDTQRITKEGTFFSARYLLVGKDFTGKDCRLFIENNGYADSLTPTLTTDSKALSFLEREALSAYLAEENGELFVHIVKREE